jgi:hypothetical protein
LLRGAASKNDGHLYLLPEKMIGCKQSHMTFDAIRDAAYKMYGYAMEKGVPREELVWRCHPQVADALVMEYFKYMWGPPQQNVRVEFMGIPLVEDVTLKNNQLMLDYNIAAADIA